MDCKLLIINGRFFEFFLFFVRCFLRGGGGEPGRLGYRFLGLGEGEADWKSAIQQTGSPRYFGLRFLNFSVSYGRIVAEGV